MKELRPLAEIARRFDIAAQRILAWELHGPKATVWTVSGQQPARMLFHRIEDSLR